MAITGGADTQYSGQGATAVGATPSATIGPVLTGGVNSSGFAEFTQLDANNYALVTLGTSLDLVDDALVAAPGGLYPSQGTATPAGTVTSLNVSLGNISLAGPTLYDAKGAYLSIENKLGGVINSATLAFADTIGSTTLTRTYTIPSVTIANNTVGDLVVPLTVGVLKSATLTVTTGTTVSSGTVKCQLLLSKDAPVLPTSYRSVPSSSAAITNNSQTQIVASPGSGMRLYLIGGTVTNSHGTVSTLVSIEDGSGGALLDFGNAQAAGGGFKIGPFPTMPGHVMPGIPLTANTALFAVCGTSGANVFVAAQCLIGPA